MDSFTAVGQPTTVGQPDAAGWVVACDPFPPVDLPSAGIPGAMQDLIHHGGLIRPGGSNFE